MQYVPDECMWFTAAWTIHRICHSFRCGITHTLIWTYMQQYTHFKLQVCVGVGVWISHLKTLWFIRSIFAYAHNVINCRALSFRLATSPHACMHVRTPTHTTTWACTRWHTYTFTHSHTNSIGGEMMKGNSKPQGQLKTLWNSVFFRFTSSQTVAVSEPFRLSPN